MAVTVELQVAPVAAVIGLMSLGVPLDRGMKAKALVAFGLGAVGPILVLLAYNTLAFGSPLDMGYFHEDVKQFSDVHSKENPLGLQGPDASKIGRLLFGGYRGLFFYGRLCCSRAGMGRLDNARTAGEPRIVPDLRVVFLVNLSYPEWTGGWSTGPRLLVPLLPFAMLAVAALLGRARSPVGASRRDGPHSGPYGFKRRIVVAGAAILTVLGAVLMLLFQGAGGQVPQFVADPLREAVVPIWTGGVLPGWHTNARFTRNLVSIFQPNWVGLWVHSWQWLQLLPLIAVQVVGIGLVMIRPRWIFREEPAGVTVERPSILDRA